MKEENSPNTEAVGKRMMFIASVIGLVMATWFFGSVEEKQFNPNQSPSSLNENNQIKVELLRNRYGHYVTTGMIDDKEVVFMLDTGATNVAIPGALEDYLNLQRGSSYQVHTANGMATVYATRIDYLKIGDIVLDNVRASISPSMEGEEILLGMAALKQLEFRQKGNQLTLIQDK